PPALCAVRRGPHPAPVPVPDSRARPAPGPVRRADAAAQYRDGRDRAHGSDRQRTDLFHHPGAVRLLAGAAWFDGAHHRRGRQGAPFFLALLPRDGARDPDQRTGRRGGAVAGRGAVPHGDAAGAQLARRPPTSPYVSRLTRREPLGRATPHGLAASWSCLPPCGWWRSFCSLPRRRRGCLTISGRCTRLPPSWLPRTGPAV